MPLDPEYTNRFDRLIDSLSTRLALTTFMVLLIATCVVAGRYVQATVYQLRSTTEVFDERQLRNGYVALSDVQRLNLIIQRAISEGSMSPENGADFQSAADILYVRTQHFAGVLSAGADLESASRSIVHLNEILEIADASIDADFANLDELAILLPSVSQEARQALVKFLDDMRRMMDSVLAEQTQAVGKQRNVVWATLAVLSVFGCSALLLLRREVTTRQGKRIAEERVRHLAFFDPLTGLANRVQYQDRLNALLWKGEPVALLFIDLDEFKHINDTYGHAAGDAVLVETSRRLSRISNQHDGFSARLGGDEFAMFFHSAKLDQLTLVCDEIMSVVPDRIGFEGESLNISVSMGLATTDQIPAGMELNVDSLSRITDFALYASKSQGRRQYTIYNNDLEAIFLERRAMIEELPKAIEDGNMEFFLQPKVCLSTERIYGFEALARWRRDGVIVPPDMFIETAEESGLITEIDRHISKSVCDTFARYNREHDTEFSVSVNFSALHFGSLSFVDFIARILSDSGLAPNLLTIEITETVQLGDLDKATTIINEIHALGAKIAIDDFGTGFSSLAYLRTTIADEIKIDRSLVSDIETSSSSLFLLDSVIGIANRLDFIVTVEGIETAQQGIFAREAGASSAQGYLYGRPLPKDAALSAARRHNASLDRNTTAA